MTSYDSTKSLKDITVPSAFSIIRKSTERKAESSIISPSLGTDEEQEADIATEKRKRNE
ncbi:hypothetical protein M141_3906 [Bacteroides fragilis str. S38L5]|nr:hypothetical protein M070_3899 [Bacteroides fragilis str. A7 (UDC12-2)]EYA94191.1 hypothetical protein M141_3906 [Bacteroides fragilis str. S38L5]EYB12700.1 hypothetical protein M140_3864 [Bacteroides fragilis str. S38L3]EYB17146.1 hypothetical protein M066_4096 [Bacteroides fragilis str. I1345]